MNITIDLAAFKSLSEWTPKIGDFVIWHGWLTHYFGIVSSIDLINKTVNIVHKGLPVLLFTMPEEDYSSNQKTISISRIKNSSPGEFSIMQNESGKNVWYV